MIRFAFPFTLPKSGFERIGVVLLYVVIMVFLVLIIGLKLIDRWEKRAAREHAPTPPNKPVAATNSNASAAGNYIERGPGFTQDVRNYIGHDLIGRSYDDIRANLGTPDYDVAAAKKETGEFLYRVVRYYLVKKDRNLVNEYKDICMTFYLNDQDVIVKTSGSNFP